MQNFGLLAGCDFYSGLARDATLTQSSFLVSPCCVFWAAARPLVARSDGGGDGGRSLYYFTRPCERFAKPRGNPEQNQTRFVFSGLPRDLWSLAVTV